MEIESGARLTFEQYQELAKSTAQYPHVGSNFIYPVLGLGNEAGEVQGKVKKILRDKGGVVDDATRLAVSAEVGDVIWYLAMTCHEFGLKFGEVAAENLTKLFDRQKRNVIKGDGDNR